MKSLKNIFSMALLGAATALPIAALAQTAAPAPAAKSTATPAAKSATAAGGDMTDAEVRKVDKENKKITLKHGAIKNLDMPPMVMVFGVTDTVLLDKVKTGDKVRFKASHEGGKYTVRALRTPSDCDQNVSVRTVPVARMIGVDAAACDCDRSPAISR